MRTPRTAAPPRPADSPYLTADEAAAYCRRRKKTLLNHKAAGTLRAVAGTRPPSPPMKSQLRRPAAKGRTARLATLLSMAKRASSKYRGSVGHWLRA